jgi:hypothetical protein
MSKHVVTLENGIEIRKEELPFPVDLMESAEYVIKDGDRILAHRESLEEAIARALEESE